MSYSLVAVLVLVGAVYACGAVRLGRRPRRTVAFYAGLAVLAAALLAPLERSFSAHMTQHLLLMIVAAPLLAYGRPVPALVAGLPPEGRDVVRRAHGFRTAGRVVAHPLMVWGLGALALWAWHMPRLYELALTNRAAHVAEHLAFVSTALLFWGVVLASGARRGVGRPVALLLVFATGVQSAALGAILAFASRPLYPSHASLADQQLAGALMWGPPAVLYIATMTWLLWSFFAEMEQDTPLVGATP